MSELILNKLRAIRSNLPLFCNRNLKIRPKQGGSLVPLVLNPVQLQVHARLEAQLQQTGKVRALVLKARQPGVSTYVAARYYHKASLNEGVNVYIIAHNQDSSSTLFSIVDTYQKNNPLAPEMGVSNAKSLKFSFLNSSYAVATAGQRATGRGKAINLYHGSEVAFWANAQDHFSASVQTVPDMPGTEIILESTANGVTGEFYNRWKEAEAHQGEYQAIFVPWYDLPEYSRPDLVTPDFELSNEPDEFDVSEIRYKELYGLSDAQMAWRRAKLQELRYGWLFKQEYPANAEEAFQNKGERGFISPALVMAARMAKTVQAGGPVIMGVDPSGPGGDRFAVAIRQGLVCRRILWRDRIDSVSAVLWLHNLIQEYKPARVFMDAGGLGSAVLSQLKSVKREYGWVVRGVNFGGTSEHRKARPHVPGPKNRRTEMWMRLEEWLSSEEQVSIPDLDLLQSEMCAPRMESTVTNDLMLEGKDSLRSRGMRSPDLTDALALTFASLFVRQEDIPAAPLLKIDPDFERFGDYTNIGSWML